MGSSKQPTPLSPSLVVAQVATIVLTYVVVSAALSFTSASNALAFYGVFHREPWNQIIHFFGVPLIIWSLLVFLAHLTLPGTPLNWAAVYSVGYFVFYLYIDPFGGLLYAPVLYVMYTTANRIKSNDQKRALTENLKKDKSGSVSWFGTGKALRLAFIVHAFSWYVQIHPGHHIIEGAQPAILSSFGKALTSAPLFAFYEGLWFIGVNKDLQDQTQQLVAEYTEELCRTGSVAMRACQEFDFSTLEEEEATETEEQQGEEIGEESTVSDS